MCAQSRELCDKLSSSQRRFRKSFLQLVMDERARQAYVQGPYKREYGHSFMETLRELTHRFVSSVEEGLPATMLHRVQSPHRGPCQVY